MYLSEGVQAVTKPSAMSKPGTQILVPGYHFSMERKQGSLEKWLILRLEERKYMMSLNIMFTKD